MSTRALLSCVLLAAQQRAVSAHGNVLCPAPRQRRDERPVDWTYWAGIHGGGPFVYGFGNSANLNANIPGGDQGAPVGRQPGGHGLCGDIGERRGFMAPNQYGPTDARGTYVAGGKVRGGCGVAGARRAHGALVSRADGRESAHHRVPRRLARVPPRRPCRRRRRQERPHHTGARRAAPRPTAAVHRGSSRLSLAAAGRRICSTSTCSRSTRRPPSTRR